jgi:hypothetical protein
MQEDFSMKKSSIFVKSLQTQTQNQSLSQRRGISILLEPRAGVLSICAGINKCANAK